MRFACSVVLTTLCLAVPSTRLPAQTGYKYRDANGQWVFSDQKSDAGVPQATFLIGHENEPLRLSVDRVDDGASTELVAINECACAATFRVAILRSAVSGIPEGAQYQARLEPNSRKTLVRAASNAHAQELRYVVNAGLGSPDAVHSPPSPYRVPFAVGSTFKVSQAYPARITHTSPDSEYAVDFLLPDGTPVYAAREGVVVNVRHDSFRGAADPSMRDQANLIEILHDDGTIALYAHLHWDSVRVHIGEHVGRGEYLANSGSTGFSSGPHLHFAVLRNAGFDNVSVPVQFAGLGGAAVAPVNLMPLTAY